MTYSENNLVRIARREKNNKRNYLVVNPLQGKHIPVKPSDALQLFSSLADTMDGKYEDEKVLFVGFAETATAIGAHVAIKRNGRYIQTTREKMEHVSYLYFTENHSHATEQKIVKDDLEDLIGVIDRIIFVEDEVTTGNTIRNIISILEKLFDGKIRFSIASLLNGMSEEHVKAFGEKQIPLHYLVKTDHSTYGAIADQYAGNGTYYEPASDGQIHVEEIQVKGEKDARRLLWAKEYEAACEELWQEVRRRCGACSGKRILVVGTEEFMYPALYVGSKLEREGNQVRCHATTRSPILVDPREKYPLHSRYELVSLYDKERRTFLYEIGAYDEVLILTDAPETETEGLATLLHALHTKNEKITLIRWC